MQHVIDSAKLHLFISVSIGLHLLTPRIIVI